MERGDFSEDLPAHAGPQRKAYLRMGLFLAHPSFLLITAPDRAIWYRIQPLGPDRMKLLTTLLLPSAVVAQENFAQLVGQDRQIDGGFSPRGPGGVHLAVQRFRR